MSDRKPNETYSKCLWWYQNHPEGPYPNHKRNIGRDCASIKRDFIGDQTEWERSCHAGWDHADPRVRHYSRLRITSFVTQLPALINVERTPEEIAASVRAIEAIANGTAGALKVNKPVEWKKENGGWKRG